MTAPNKNIIRSILRVFEIALFFAISVLGYGMLAKTSGSGTKSKHRDLSSRIQKTLPLNGAERELREFRSNLFARAGIANHNRDDQHAGHSAMICASPASLPEFLHHPRFHDPFLRSVTSVYLPLPCNLLQQNPVLLT